jgi:prepilin signal peptidase PulO-like enzyme (type II secretory pathway)
MWTVLLKAWDWFKTALEFLLTLYLLYILLLFLWSTFSYFLPYGSFVAAVIVTALVAIYIGYKWILSYFGEREEE